MHDHSLFLTHVSFLSVVWISQLPPYQRGLPRGVELGSYPGGVGDRQGMLSKVSVLTVI